MLQNLFTPLPDARGEEIFTDLVNSANVRIERIVTKGQITPEGEWYDQEQHEFVLLLQGEAQLTFSDKVVDLKAGDYLTIPKHCRHRVTYTSVEPECVWLAVFYDD